MNPEQAELITTRPGARLQHERKARGLSISDIAAKINIRERIVLALENDDTDWIAPVYLRGYIKAYATELGLDPDQLEAEARANAGEDPELRSVFNIDPKRGLTERWLKSGGYLVATALVAALIWQVTQQAVQFSQGSHTAGNDVQTSSEPGTDIGNSEPDTHVAASIASLESLRPSPVDHGSAGEQAWSAITSPLSSPSIHITVSADSWVEITDGMGNTIEKDLIRGGNERSYEGMPPFELHFGKPSAVVLEFNGEPIDLTPHIEGEVARLTLGAVEEYIPE